MEYVRTAAPVVVQLFGPDDAGYLLHITGKLIGMQYYDELATSLDAARGSPRAFAEFLKLMFEASGDRVELETSGGACRLVQHSWKLMDGLPDAHPACARLLDGLVEGMAAGAGRGIPVARQFGSGHALPYIWIIG
jgi:hypothetical protein